MRNMEDLVTIWFQDFGLNFSTINNTGFSEFYIIASEKNGLRDTRRTAVKLKNP